jgi:hypothetical protein
MSIFVSLDVCPTFSNLTCCVYLLILFGAVGRGGAVGIIVDKMVTTSVVEPWEFFTFLWHVWFTTSVATFCLTFLSKVSYSIQTTNLRQIEAHLATNQTGPNFGQNSIENFG